MAATGSVEPSTLSSTAASNIEISRVFVDTTVFFPASLADLVHRRQGGSLETDAEFYNSDGTVALQVEAKKSPREVARLVAAIGSAHRLSELPPKVCKEIEYVLDLSPEQLWVVGPGSIDPAIHVFDVHVDGLDATFTPSKLRRPH